MNLLHFLSGLCMCMYASDNRTVIFQLQLLTKCIIIIRKEYCKYPFVWGGLAHQGLQDFFFPVHNIFWRFNKLSINFLIKIFDSAITIVWKTTDLICFFYVCGMEKYITYQTTWSKLETSLTLGKDIYG